MESDSLLAASQDPLQTRATVTQNPFHSTLKTARNNTQRPGPTSKEESTVKTVGNIISGRVERWFNVKFSEKSLSTILPVAYVMKWVVF
jgi:hypothetical protein